MHLTPLIQKAINRSAELHREHVRKFSGVPYIVHPFSVAIILSEYTTDEHTIAAGLLHDVVEDVENYELEDVQDEFGKRVAKIVRGVTEIKHSASDTEEAATWNERKNAYIANLKKAPEESLLVAAADKIHNIHSLLDAHNDLGDEFWNRFHGSPQKQVWFFEEVYKVISDRTDNQIVGLYGQALSEIRKLVEPYED